MTSDIRDERRETRDERFSGSLQVYVLIYEEQNRKNSFARIDFSIIFRRDFGGNMTFSKKISFPSAILSSVMLLVWTGCSEESRQEEIKFPEFSDYQDIPVELWESIADSPHIVEGNFRIDTNKIAESGNQRVYQIEVDVSSSLKGNIPQGTVSLDEYTICGYSFCDNEKVFSLNGKKVIAFINNSDWTSEAECYLTRGSKYGIFQHSEELLNTIKNEIVFQSKITNSTLCEWVQQKDTNFTTVKGYIEDMMDESRAENSYVKLEEMGMSAVPSMICLMDDRRELAVKHIELKNKWPDAWEAYRFYGPEVVIDVLGAILNQITGSHFGNFFSDASDSERQDAINGWRVYLWHMLNKDK